MRIPLPARTCLIVLALTVATFVPGAALAAAAPHERSIGASIVETTRATSSDCAQCGPGGTPETLVGCGYDVFVQFPDVAQATGYRIVVDDSVTGTRTFSGSPSGDRVDGFAAPSGSHRFGLTGGGVSSGACPDVTGRFRVVSAVASFDNRLRLAGAVQRADGSPVVGAPVRISGPSAAAASTNAGGYYAERLTHAGRYTVTAGPNFCVVAITPCRHELTVEVTSGTRTVDFRQASQYEILGVIRDEFQRGLAGITVRATGADGDVATTDAAGRYRLRVGRPGTYDLRALAPAGGGPHELFYVLDHGSASQGTAADVTLAAGVPSATVDFELDRRLQYTLQAPSIVADGFSRATVALIVRTQHGDPAPGVALNIDPPVGAHPRAVICGAGASSRPLWPDVLSDGSVSPAGLSRGPELTTDAAGQVLLRIFPGLEPGAFVLTGARADDPADTFAGTVSFGASVGRTMSAGQLADALQHLSPTGKEFFGNEDVVLAALAESQDPAVLGRNPGAISRLAGMSAAPIERADGRRALLFFSEAAPPRTTAGGLIVPRSDLLVLDNSLTRTVVTKVANVTSLTAWAAGQSVSVRRSDSRTYLDWPVPTTANGGLGTCLAAHQPTVMSYAAHSPVHLLLVDIRGRRLGTDGHGHHFASMPGVAFTAHGVQYVLAPRASDHLIISGIGNGPVVLEAGTGAGETVARFAARPGAQVTLPASGSLPAGFGFAGRRAQVQRGMPLVLRGLPSRVSSRHPNALRLLVSDALGRPLPGAAMSATGAGLSLAFAGNPEGVIRARIPPVRGRVLTLVVTAPGASRLRVRLRVG